MRIPSILLRAAQRKAESIMTSRDADFFIGGKEDPYMMRWWVIPRNKWFNIYLHRILKSDRDEALHDHPWVNVSLLVRGRYLEVTPSNVVEDLNHGPETIEPLMEGELRFRWPTSCHRLIRPDDARQDVITFFVTGPVWRHWGFHCKNGWRHWKDFVGFRDEGQNIQGRGCGEMDGPSLKGGRISIFSALKRSSENRPS